jgi:hypothetical protein
MTIADQKLILKLINCGFYLKEAWIFLRQHRIFESYTLKEEKGFSVINDYALERIKVV